MIGWYTVPIESGEDEMGPYTRPKTDGAAHSVAYRTDSEALIIAAPGLVGIDGEYHGEDGGEGVRDAVIAEARRMGAPDTWTPSPATRVIDRWSDG